MPDHPADRLGRIEASVEKLAEETRSFQTAMRGAITVQQEPLAELRAIQTENARHIGALTANVAKHDEAIANLERQWQAYLSTIHPRQ